MNKKITEDYVSFEVAKLLKEKGFNPIYCGMYYSSTTGKRTTELLTSLIACPTLQMVMKWLREIHKWSIQVFPVFDNLKWCYDIYELKIQKYHSRPDLMPNKDYDTYEEAAEAAIKYCLTNLI